MIRVLPIPLDEDIIELVDAFALPWISRQGVRQDTPLCFSDDKQATWREQNARPSEGTFSSGVRLDVAHEQRQVSPAGETDYDYILREILEPVKQACPTLRDRSATPG